jgi:hypothetical protein
LLANKLLKRTVNICVNISLDGKLRGDLMAVKVELKHEENFKRFLCNKFDNQRVISDCISRCKRVQIHEGDLTDHFINDGGQLLLSRLDYNVNDANQGKQPKHSITFQGKQGFKSIYDGTKSLESAVRHYFEFMRNHLGR